MLSNKNDQSATYSRLVKLFNKKPLAGLSENLKK